MRTCGFGSSKNKSKKSKRKTSKKKMRKSKRKSRKRSRRSRRKFGVDTPPIDHEFEYESPPHRTPSPNPRHRKNSRRVIPARRIQGITLSPKRITDLNRVSPCHIAGNKKIRRQFGYKVLSPYQIIRDVNKNAIDCV